MKSWFKKYNEFEDCAIIATYMFKEITFQNKKQKHQAKEMSKPKHTGISITNQNQQVFIWKVNLFND